MLSTENPPSSDPSCTPPRNILQLKSGGDERASNKVPLQEVDLLKSSLDYDNPLPKFSIRDYVFNARSKDIKTNWPFPQKNLQLCLKHGVKDLLPPFQTLESVRNRCIERCKAVTSPIEKESIENFDGEPSMPTDLVSASFDNPGCSQNLAVDCENLGLEGSEGEKKDNQVPLNTNNQSQSEIDPVPGDKSQNKNQTQIKKYRLIVKVGGGAVDPSSNEDHTTNFESVSETMASKICPVCKTFSFSSNTTLNAHIDQCLSLDSNMKWTPDSRVIKHRIKPRKMRLMTDIYATAPHCTLEELDRRNGTNWAINTSFPTQENEDCSDDGNERVASVDFKENGNEGAVYIDANGTKVRILSKFNDASSSVPKTEADFRNQNFVKGGKGNKLVSNYKKKHHAQKHQKYVKLALQNNKFCSPKPPCTTEVRGDGEKTCALIDNCRKVGSLAQPFKAQQQMKCHDSGTMMKWACSKRTVLFKKRNLKEGLQSLGRNFRQEFPVESDHQSSLGDSYMERSCIQKTPNLHEDPLSSPEIRKRMRDTSVKTPFRIKNTPTSGDETCKGFANNGEHYVPFIGKEPSRSQHAFSSKAPMFSSLKKRVLSSGHSVVPKSKCKMKKFRSDKKSGMCFSTESHKEVMVIPSKIVGQHDSKPKHRENLSQIPGKASLCKSGVLTLKRKRGAFGNSQYVEARSLKSKSECHRHEVGNNLHSSARVGRDFTDTIVDTVISPSLGVDLVGNAMNLRRSIAPEFHKLGSLSLHDEREIFCIDTAGDHKIAKNTDVGEGGMDSQDGQVNYFSEIDPIPIPGPPGSYLPSPKDMGSEDLQGNSSITMSRVHSSEDHRDLVDRDSSDSPISATSTISNSMITRSDSRSSEKLFTLDENSLLQHPSFCLDAVAGNNYVPVPQAANIQYERANLQELKNNMMVPRRGFTSFRNDQPCCCSRKEGVSQGVSLNYQESQLLRRRSTASAPTEKQQIGDLDWRPNGFNSMPEEFSIDNFPVTKSSASVKISVDSALSSPVFGDCDSASPSPSAPNSILRLMGKNLMVVNKDENISPQLKPVTQAISPNDHLNQHFQKLSGLFPGNSQSEDFPSFYRMVHQFPNMGFGSYATSKTPQASSPLASSGVIFSKNVRKNVGGYNFPNHQYKSWNENADNTTNPMKEIIVIDEETPARKADSAADIAPFSEIMMENRVSSAGITVPMASDYDSRYMNHFYSYQPQDYPPNSESKPLVAQNASFQIPPHIRASSNSISLKSPLHYSMT